MPYLPRRDSDFKQNSATGKRDLFDSEPSYPALTSFKTRGSLSNPSHRIAGSVAKLRQRIVDELLRNGRSTADEMAHTLNVSPLMTRPRLSEVRSAGRIAPTGERGRNSSSGLSATVWRATRLPMVPDAAVLGAAPIQGGSNG
jgi:hypothetical protein